MGFAADSKLLSGVGRTQMSLLQSESDLPEECNKWANLTMLQATPVASR